MPATWPAIRSPLLESYSVTDNPQVETTEMSSGPKRRALMSQTYPSSGRASVVLDSAAEATLFRSFWQTSLNYGIVSVDMPLDTGEGTATHEAHISNVSWQVLVPNSVYKVSFDFETFERL